MKASQPSSSTPVEQNRAPLKPMSQGKANQETPAAKKTYGCHATMPVLAADKYAEVELPNLDEFNPEELKIDATLVACGKRRTGKSWCFRNIMYLMKDKIPAGIVISQTDELNKFWRDYVPKKYIYNKYQPEILDAVFKRQKEILNDTKIVSTRNMCFTTFLAIT